MIFENSHLIFQVIDVLQLSQKNMRCLNRNRHFCALSFRRKSDAVIRCEGKTWELQPGSIAFFPAEIEYEREASVDEMTVIHFELFNYAFHEIETFVTSRTEAIGALFGAAYAEWMKNRPDRRYRVTALLNQIFADLYIEYAQRSSGYSPLVSRAVSYIGRHFTDASLTVPSIARHAGVSEVYLRRLFSQELNTSPKAYVTKLRLQYATSLLDSGYYTVSEVAERAGFSDEKYFATVFKRTAGVSPSRYVYSFQPERGINDELDHR